MRKSKSMFILLAGFLAGCSEPDNTPPKVTITSPISGSVNPLTGTIPVQVSASDDSGIAKVKLFVRDQGSSGKGVYIGEANTTPYIIPWSTNNIPNALKAELYAEAIDQTGMISQSGPVYVKPINNDLPQLTFFVAYTFPNPPVSPVAQKVTSEDVNFNFPPTLNATRTGVPHPDDPVSYKEQVISQDSIPPQYALRWGWLKQNTLNSVTVSKYHLYTSLEDAVGAYRYVKRVNQPTVAGSAFAKQVLPEGIPLTKEHVFHGIVTAVTANNMESGLSNTMRTSFLMQQPQNLNPAPDAVVSTGQPTLNWAPLDGADEYLFYVYTSDPRLGDPAWVWSNYPKSTPALSVTYPNTAPLTKGTYYWWVAGVKYNGDSPVAFSFSEPTKFMVP